MKYASESDRQVYILKDGIKKLVDDETKTDKADMKAYLMEVRDMTGEAKAGADIGRFHATIALVKGRETVDGAGEDFETFMFEKGMCALQVKPEWKEHVAIVGGQVVWTETGEVVPGATVTRSADYPKVSGIKRDELPELLREAQRAGLIGGELPLLGGE